METTDYVSYPIALKLKKAGFDWPCHYGYSVKMRLEPEPSFGEPKMVHSKVPKNYNDNRKGIEKGLEFCSAVPLWQAQKWLREKKDIVVTVDFEPVDDCDMVYTYRIQRHDPDGGKAVWDCWKSTKSLVIGVSCFSGGWGTYEGALAGGIEDALKLIKEGE